MVNHVREKGQGHSQPNGKGKGKGKGNGKHVGKGNHNQDQAGSPNEDGQRTLGDFGIKRQRVEFVGNVKENMMILRLPDWIGQLMCFALKSAGVI